MAKIICMEGHDKSGKETQSKLLQQSLINAGYKTFRVEVPTKSCPKTYAIIYDMLKNGYAKKWPNFFQFIQFLNKWFFQLNVLPVLSECADIIIFDRWALSSVVYGGATGVNSTINMLMYKMLKKADMTFVFYGKSFRRNTVDDSYEKDVVLQEHVKKAYYDWTLEHSTDHILIKNDQTVDAIHNSIMFDLCTKGIL